MNTNHEAIDVEAKNISDTAGEKDMYRAPESDVEPPRKAVVDTSLINLSWVSYILHLVVALGAVLPSLQVSVLLLLLAFILDLVKRSDAEGTWLESHFSFRISSVIWAGVFYAVTAPLWLLVVVPGWAAWGLISLWFLYRIVKGMLALSKEQEVS